MERMVRCDLCGKMIYRCDSNLCVYVYLCDECFNKFIEWVDENRKKGADVSECGDIRG